MTVKEARLDSEANDTRLLPLVHMTALGCFSGGSKVSRKTWLIYEQFSKDDSYAEIKFE